MTSIPKRTLEWMFKVKYSYNFLTNGSQEMGPNVSRAKVFSINS